MENSPRILIVEDEILIAFSLKVELSKIGYSICGIAARGNEAITMALELSPDVVLMDIGLKGGMDGITAADHLAEKAHIPIIFLSGYMDEENQARAAHFHPLACLSKPISISHLKDALEKLPRKF